MICYLFFFEKSYVHELWVKKIRNQVLLFYFLPVFHISVNWWGFTRVWMIASVHGSKGIFSAFCLILKVLGTVEYLDCISEEG